MDKACAGLVEEPEASLDELAASLEEAEDFSLSLFTGSTKTLPCAYKDFMNSIITILYSRVNNWTKFWARFFSCFKCLINKRILMVERISLHSLMSESK